MKEYKLNKKPVYLLRDICEEYEVDSRTILGLTHSLRYKDEFVEGVTHYKFKSDECRSKFVKGNHGVGSNVSQNSNIYTRDGLLLLERIIETYIDENVTPTSFEDKFERVISRYHRNIRRELKQLLEDELHESKKNIKVGIENEVVLFEKFKRFMESSQ